MTATPLPTAPIRRACCALIDADPTMEAEMVEMVARALMDGSLWKGAFDNALMYGGQEAERDVWRDHARRATAALDLPARLAAARRDGMEAMRKAAIDRCWVEKHATGRNPGAAIDRCISAIEAVDVRHLVGGKR